MWKRFAVEAGAVAMLGSLVPSNLAAQSPPPKAYSMTAVSSMTEVTMFTGKATEVKAYRDGSKELVEVTVAAAAGSPAVHMRYLFDFEAHKAYTVDVVNKSCGWMRYVSANAPMNYDTVSGSAGLLGALASAKVLGVETVNGIRSRSYQMPGAPGEPTSRIWIADKEGFIVKVEMVDKSGAARPMLDVKQVTYGKPSADLFTAPPSCTTQTPGEWSETGVDTTKGGR